MNSSPPSAERQELRPSAIGIALAFADIEAPDFAGPFTYAEANPGQPAHYTAFAAAYPQATFVKADTASMDIDVLALNRVWSWVGDEQRLALAALMRERLKPGGVVVVDYATPPGAVLPAVLQRAGLEMAEAARDAGSLFFKANPQASAILDAMRGRPTEVLFQAFSFPEINKTMNECGLAYAGSARLADAITKLNFSKEATELLRAEPDLVIRELKKDLMLNRGHRCDIFVRDPVYVGTGGGAEHIARTVFRPVLPPGKIDALSLITAYAEIKPTARARSVFAALAQGPASAMDLAGRRAAGCENVWANVEAMLALMAMDAVAPLP